MWAKNHRTGKQHDIIEIFELKSQIDKNSTKKLKKSQDLDYLGKSFTFSEH